MAKTILITQFLAIAAQCLHRFKVISFSHSASLHPTGVKLKVNKKLRRETTGTADSNYPEGYSIPYNVMLRKKSEENREASSIVVRAQRLPGHHSVVGGSEHLHQLLPTPLSFLHL